MAKTTAIRARITEDKRAAGEAVLSELGMTTSQALTIFWEQMIARGEFPLELIAASKQGGANPRRRAHAEPAE